MKKLIIFLGIIILIGTNTTSLIACNKPKYTETKLKELKKENKLKINNKEIRDNLEWMAEQEKSFKQVDNKWYFVIWRGEKDHDWRIVKFKHTELKVGKIIDEYNNYYTLELREEVGYPFYFILYVRRSTFFGPTPWQQDSDGTYIKTVYRWNEDYEPIALIIDPKIGKVTD